jgi:hypothetical protein
LFSEIIKVTDEPLQLDIMKPDVMAKYKYHKDYCRKSPQARKETDAKVNTYKTKCMNIKPNSTTNP